MFPETDPLFALLPPFHPYRPPGHEGCLCVCCGVVVVFLLENCDRCGVVIVVILLL